MLQPMSSSAAVIPTVLSPRPSSPNAKEGLTLVGASSGEGEELVSLLDGHHDDAVAGGRGGGLGMGDHAHGHGLGHMHGHGALVMEEDGGHGRTQGKRHSKVGAEIEMEQGDGST